MDFEPNHAKHYAKLRQNVIVQHSQVCYNKNEAPELHSLKTLELGFAFRGLFL